MFEKKNAGLLVLALLAVGILALFVLVPNCPVQAAPAPQAVEHAVAEAVQDSSAKKMSAQDSAFFAMAEAALGLPPQAYSSIARLDSMRDVFMDQLAALRWDTFVCKLGLATPRPGELERLDRAVVGYNPNSFSVLVWGEFNDVGWNIDRYPDTTAWPGLDTTAATQRMNRIGSYFSDLGFNVIRLGVRKGVAGVSYKFVAYVPPGQQSTNGASTCPCDELQAKVGELSARVADLENWRDQDSSWRTNIELRLAQNSKQDSLYRVMAIFQVNTLEQRISNVEVNDGRQPPDFSGTVESAKPTPRKPPVSILAGGVFSREMLVAGVGVRLLITSRLTATFLGGAHTYDAFQFTPPQSSFNMTGTDDGNGIAWQHEFSPGGLLVRQKPAGFFGGFLQFDIGKKNKEKGGE